MIKIINDVSCEVQLVKKRTKLLQLKSKTALITTEKLLRNAMNLITF